MFPFRRHGMTRRGAGWLGSLLVLFCIVAVSPLKAQTAGDSLRISLLTCSRGDDVASAFGHSAVRVSCPSQGMDIVFNYGTYDFNAPHFVLNFMRGRMIYMLSATYFDDFISDYRFENRAVREQEFNLTAEQKNAVYAFLLHNWNTDARYYRYDYFIDNCATRIRDIFLKKMAAPCDSIRRNFTPSRTFRSEFGSLCLYDWPWLRFGIDLLLGARIDEPLSFEEEMFIPSVMAEHFSDCEIGGGPLVGESVLILPNRPDENEAASRIASVVTAPFGVFTLLSIIFVLLFLLFKGNRRRTFVTVFSGVYFTILGLCGTLFLLLWFCTDHYWTGLNWNLVWANPLFFIPVFQKCSRARNVLIWCLAAVSLLLLVCQAIVPQALNPAITPLILLTAFLAFTSYDRPL